MVFVNERYGHVQRSATWRGRRRSHRPGTRRRPLGLRRTAFWNRLWGQIDRQRDALFADWIPWETRRANLRARRARADAQRRIRLGLNQTSIPVNNQGPNRLNTPAGLPGHANQRRVDVYNEHVQALRNQQSQNPNWVGTRVQDPTITQQSMEDFLVRLDGTSNVDPRTGLRLRRDAEGRGVTNWRFLGDFKKN